MKTRKLELDVDYIGGQGSLTESEEKALSEFFKKRRLASLKGTTEKKRRRIKQLKETV